MALIQVNYMSKALFRIVPLNVILLTHFILDPEPRGMIMKLLSGKNFVSSTTKVLREFSPKMIPDSLPAFDMV